MDEKISIIIPAHNEADRIAPTLLQYDSFFQDKKNERVLDYELLVVLNGCTDSTYDVVSNLNLTHVRILDLKQSGKGYAITQGFADSLKRDATTIGYVDADGATAPEYFYDLITQMGEFDGCIASRYMKGSVVTPPRPLIKRWGSKLVYETLVLLLFQLNYHDLQCGAKVFKRVVIEKVTPHLSVTQWAFDVQLLYLCRRFGFKIKEIPTVWHDQAGSKLALFGGGMKMLKALIMLRFEYVLRRKKHHKKN